ncbi:MAG: hypothetical protein KC415_22925 [Anaerolineales bacterium]|nr:hypothetical protein [Anaerolineales bacterium]MCB8991822.1 hypothetical protein [Ardenticatenaceae bacterium]
MNHTTKRDSEFYRRIGSKGGRTTVAKHGREHMQRIGRKGFESTTQRYFRSEAEHKHWLTVAGAHQYWRSTGLPMKCDRDGRPVWPAEMPPHPAHDDYTEF